MRESLEVLSAAAKLFPSGHRSHAFNQKNTSSNPSPRCSSETGSRAAQTVSRPLHLCWRGEEEASRWVVPLYFRSHGCNRLAAKARVGREKTPAHRRPSATLRCLRRIHPRSGQYVARGRCGFRALGTRPQAVSARVHHVFGGVSCLSYRSRRSIVSVWKSCGALSGDRRISRSAAGIGSRAARLSDLREVD
jgi:hypothetical protein